MTKDVKILMNMQAATLAVSATSIALVNLIKSGKSYIAKAEQIGKVLFNVYYRQAELDVFEIFVSSIRKKDCTKIIEDYENALNKSLDLKPTLQALTIKRQLYSLIGNSKDEDNTNLKIMEVNKENAIKWQE